MCRPCYLEALFTCHVRISIIGQSITTKPFKSQRDCENSKETRSRLCRGCRTFFDHTRRILLSHFESQTGFEFRKRRATPIIEGIVVASENETLVLDVRGIVAAAILDVDDKIKGILGSRTRC